MSSWVSSRLLLAFTVLCNLTLIHLFSCFSCHSLLLSHSNQVDGLIALKGHHGPYLYPYSHLHLSFPGSSAGKETACNAGNSGSISGLGSSPGEGIGSVQFSSVAQSCLTLCDPMDCSTPGLPAHHQVPEFTQTHVHLVSDAIQPSHHLLSPSPPALNLSQHQGLFK